MGSGSENNEVFDDNSSFGEESDDLESFSNKYPNMVSPGGVSESLGTAENLSGEGSTSHTDVVVNDIDSLSKIRRCNIRILKRPNSPCPSKSNEIENIVHLGNQLGFGLLGKESEISHILNNSVPAINP
ncbi:hypothetical protein Tco_0845627 [Tanacetum coccineum]